jgi:hypothetical protein
MGSSSSPDILFNLEELSLPTMDLSHLAEPFSKEEIDQVIKTIPNDKAPGPDGFNAQFLKRCWHIINLDFYQLCQEFCTSNLSLQAINNSLITLIPKVNSLETANDFRPISILNSVLKLLTKVMANRLQSVILNLIHKTQYGFIKSRTIQDCIAWVFELLNPEPPMPLVQERAGGPYVRF